MLILSKSIKKIASAWIHLRRLLHPIKVFLIWIRFLHVPLLAASAGSGLAWVAYSGVGPAALVKGAFDGEAKWSLLLAPFSMFYAIALWEISRVILNYGPARFGLEACKGLPYRIGQVTLALVFSAVPVFTALACYSTTPGGFGTKQWCVWLACAPMMVLGYIWLSRVVNRFLVRRIQEYLLLSGFNAQGYTFVDENNRAHGLGAGHVLQGILFLLSTVYVFFLSRFPSEDTPVALYVLVILLTTAWLCSGLGFFLAKHRVPLLLVLILWVTIFGPYFHKPYTYEAEKISRETPLPQPLDILEVPYSEVSSPGVPRRIAVAAVGGGIHAGAWEAEVLTRLQAIEGFEDLPKRLALLSGTSGGAYGAMHYVNSMFGNGCADGFALGKKITVGQLNQLGEIRTIVQKSSLGAVIHSLAYDDLPGYFHPQISPLDRGNAMELRWVENAKSEQRNDISSLENATLAEWGQKAAAGRMPAVFFTSGTEESGRPTIYGSSAVADWNWNAIQSDKEPFGCACNLENYTVRAVTGARLSASFPYVSPAASPNVPRNTLRRSEHQVDGGLYDNYGIVALNQWLDEGLLAKSMEYDRRHPKPKDLPTLEAWTQQKKTWMATQGFGKILIIQIRYEAVSEEPELATDGFFHQAFAPLKTLMTTRVAGQRIRADRHFDAFCRYWKELGVQIDNAAFDFHGPSPLSWHLTKEDRDKLSANGIRIGNEFNEYLLELKALEARYSEGKERDVAIEELNRRLPLGAASHVVSEFLKSQSK